mmetsp:Transcript_19542/g.31626  ORF Transcript_19542/g.31626 Transcript_19542/m.31626 type:complete len:275 (-) Transcript_19542:491-1315(-)
MATVSAVMAPAAVVVNVNATSDTAGPMNPTPCVNLRTVVTETPLAMRWSARIPAKTPVTAMVAHGSALKYADLANSRPTTCLKYRGIHARRMKYPQLLTKLATMHAQTGALDSSSLNGTAGTAPSVFVAAGAGATTAPPSSIRRRSAAFTLELCAGKVVAVIAHTAAHATPSAPKNTKGPAIPPAASIAGAANRPTMLPLWKPPMQAATARERSALGTHLAVRLFMHGSATPSPSPITARVANSSGRLVAAANGVAMVARDHSRIPPPSTALPP